jgi:integrase
VRRDRVLDDKELAAVWRAAEQLGYPVGHAVRLLILTGARRDEIAKLRWAEIEEDTIHLKGERTKNGEAHDIPLSAPARGLLVEEVPRISDDYVLTFNGVSPISNWDGPKRHLDKISGVTGWRLHDLRRSLATGLQKLGVALQVTEAILGHTSGSRAGVIGIYQRHDYADEKRAALEAWGARITALIDGGMRGKVLPMQARRRGL